MFDVALENRTPFEAATHVQVDGDGQEVLVAVLSASFAALDDAPDGDGSGLALDLAPEQAPVAFEDVPSGEPGRSSTRQEADIAPHKPRVDVVVRGCAHAPGGRPADEVMVGLCVADIRKTLRVSGDRALLAHCEGAPAPFLRLPVVYERAFGGTLADGDVYLENPVGVGYRNAASGDASVASRLPNIEYPDRPTRGSGDHFTPAGFGIVARHWMPRARLAGTYDQHWIDEVWPLAPADFDPLFNQIAPPDQQTAALAGGETVELRNLTASGLWRFRLPRLDVPARLVFDDRVEDRALRIDTVLIDADARTVTLKARLAVTAVRNAPRLRALVFGHVSAGWLAARQRGKRYLDSHGGDGTLAGRPAFHP
jgi:hypothetical protein